MSGRDAQQGAPADVAANAAPCLNLVVEAVENPPTRSHTGKICLGGVRLMNLDFEAEESHDPGNHPISGFSPQSR